MTLPAALIVTALWLTLAYLVLFDAAVERRRRDRADLRRVGGRVRVDPPRFDGGRRRADPSPVPRCRRVADHDEVA